MAYFRTLPHRIVSIVLLCVALIGCDAPADAELTIEATFEPSLEPTDARVVTDEPSPIITNTPTATPEPSATPTPDGLPTATPDFGSLEGWTVSESRDFTSLDGDWVVHSIFAYALDVYPDYHSYLSVEKLDGSVTWVAEDRWELFAFGYMWAVPYRWSNDGKDLYYTHLSVSDGCHFFPSAGWDLFRLNLATGEIISLIDPVYEWKQKGVALSPDETLVAAFAADPVGFIVYDIARKERKEFPLPEGIAGWPHGKIVWAPDQSSLMFTSIQFANCAEPNASHSIVRIDRESKKVTIVIDNSKMLLTTVDWPEQDRVLLEDDNGREWWLDPITGDLTPHD
jgi:hypothetical protein